MKLLTLIYSLGLLLALPLSATERPNFVIIFTDDQGYGDLGCFGSTNVSTPRIDQMAAEGARLTSFYMAAPYCTPSRAALMTRSYPSPSEVGYGSPVSALEVIGRSM